MGGSYPTNVHPILALFSVFFQEENHQFRIFSNGVQEAYTRDRGVPKIIIQLSQGVEGEKF